MADQAEPVKLTVRPLINPLTEDDRMLLEQVMNHLPMIEDLLHRAERCGCPVTERWQKHEVHKQVATALRDHFFPVELPSTQE
jgi:hypothetical protein